MQRPSCGQVSADSVCQFCLARMCNTRLADDRGRAASAPPALGPPRALPTGFSVANGARCNPSATPRFASNHHVPCPAPKMQRRPGHPFPEGPRFTFLGFSLEPSPLPTSRGAETEDPPLRVQQLEAANAELRAANWGLRGRADELERRAAAEAEASRDRRSAPGQDQLTPGRRAARRGWKNSGSSTTRSSTGRERTRSGTRARRPSWPSSSGGSLARTADSRATTRSWPAAPGSSRPGRRGRGTRVACARSSSPRRQRSTPTATS